MGLTATVNAAEVERGELTWLLSSGVLGRSNNLARMLTFICEKYFEGREDQIKEYTIAVEALGRRADFDPHVDTIVRVTAHSLRKRLQEVYQHEGAGRPVHVVIPPGNYVPSFIANTAPKGFVSTGLVAEVEPEKVLRAVEQPPVPPDVPVRRGFTHAWMVPALFMLLVAILSGALLMARKQAVRSARMAGEPAGLLSPSGSPMGIRLLPGADRQTYVDHSGNTWLPATSCDGGSSVRVPEQRIVGTEDPSLYMGGIRGISHCIFPVEAGLYEIHFHFAETTNLQAATRVAVLSVNARPNINFDVVDDAAGDGIATSLVMTGVRPENDGAIHVDFMSETSLLNAVEILPTSSEALLPVRIVAGSGAFTDAAKQVWLSDRYFSGGRRGQISRTSRTADLGIYSYDRVGHFRYTIPVLAKEKYRVRLFFREPWYGKGNGGPGGPGNRIFDVSCNGSSLLKDFDVMAEGGSAPVVKTFDNVQATAQGKIELSFTPVVNYPFVNAIEVVPEPEP